jgi:hypothetical protein
MTNEQCANARREGRQSAYTDHSLGRMNAYAYYGILDCVDSYSHQYSLGYRAEWARLNYERS